MFAEILDMKAAEQQEELKRDLDAVASDQARTQVAALKIQRMLGKVGKEAAGMARDVLMDIISETAPKIVYPGQK
jgi:hypothetical protein